MQKLVQLALGCAIFLQVSIIIVTPLYQGCVDQSWCKEENSHCSVSGFCYCLPGYTPLHIGYNNYSNKIYVCVITPSLVGGICNNNTDCPSPAICESTWGGYPLTLDSACVCPPDTHTPSLNLTQCQKYAEHIGDQCKNQEICEKVSNSECFSGRCLCKTGHVASSDQSSCLRMAVQLSDQCEENIQCESLLGPETVCTEGKCFCKYGYTYNADRNRCHPFVENVGDYCEINEQCVFPLGHAKCNAQGHCRCAEGYEADENGSQCLSLKKSQISVL